MPWVSIPRLRPLQRDEAPDHQAGTDEKDERQRDLERHDAAAEPASGGQPARAAGLAQQIHDVGARGAQRRHEPEHDRGHQRRAHGKRHHRRIDPHVLKARQVLRAERQQQPDADPREPDAGDGAGAGEHQALGEQLAHEARPRAPERRPHRQLALARGRADEQQVRDVGARDEQHERHRPHERQDRGPDVGDQILVHRLDAEVHAGRLLDGKLRAQTRRHGLDLLLRPGARDAAPEARDHAEEDVDAGAGREIDPQRRPQIGRALDVRAGGKQQLEPGLEHADHLERLIAQAHDGPDDGGVAAEAALPELVAEDRARRRRRRRLRGRRSSGSGAFGGGGGERRPVGLGEIRSHHDPGSEHAKEIRRRRARADDFRVAVATGPDEHLPARRQRGNPVERSGLRAEIVEVRRGPREVGDVAVAHVLPDVHEARGRPIRQRREEHRIHDAEDRGCGANAKRQRRDRGDRKRRFLVERPDRVGHVGDEGQHGEDIHHESLIANP